jgi:8-oxo-dGTP pyrophosphatase MutT (NUDIX family)
VFGSLAYASFLQFLQEGIVGLEEYGLGAVPDYSSFIIARVFDKVPEIVGDRRAIPNGYVMVIDPKYGDASKWKIAAGHVADSDATPLHTARREFRGETGIDVPLERFSYLGKSLGRRGDHWKCFFVADISSEDRNWMHDQDGENEGERPGYFSLDDFRKLIEAGKVLPDHCDALAEYALIPER